MNIVEKTILRLIKFKITKWFELERSLAKLKNVYKSTEESPVKSWPDPNKVLSGNELPFSLNKIPIVGGSLRSCISQGEKAITSIKENPSKVKNLISEAELKDFEEFARINGVGAIGFTKVPQHLIFKERAVLYDSAIVLTMEMDKSAILEAPSLKTFSMIMSTYNKLGIITNKLTNKLRQMGFQAQASHPLGGLVLYPPLAVNAGLGWFGRHGLLITPQFGPRQRISAIFTNIDNLPISKRNEHSWISEFCEKCGKCIKACPSQAILYEPLNHKSGRKTQIIREKCLPIFVNQNGCTVCVKECAFTASSYEDLLQNHKAKL